MTDQLAEHIDMLYGSPMTVIADCMRSFICAPPGRDLIASDYANIEGRALAWLAGEEWKLEAFRDFDAKRGPDMYLISAARIWEKPVTAFTKASPERQHGKVGELACGYQGGVGAFQDMARTYLLTIADELAEKIVAGWRAANPAIVQYWKDLDRASINAVAEPGAVFQAGAAGRQVRFKKSGSFLFCQVPSKGVIVYPYPSLVEVGFYRDPETKRVHQCPVYQVEKFKQRGWDAWTKPQLNFWGVDSTTKQWRQQSTYGGSISENVTQKVCRDLLAQAMTRIDAAGYDIVLHVHDECVVEVDHDAPPGTQARIDALMSASEPWARDLPVVAKGWRGHRYRKG